MRNRAEILGQGLSVVKQETVPTQSDLKLRLLTLEALVDIRDELNETNNILASIQKTIGRTY